ncbi:MAG: GGDEF domain-containing protein [Spirochaetaceae bacterium]|nr:GGDEF domain-containing protein [Spirochaetaceae bacterium]
MSDGFTRVDAQNAEAWDRMLADPEGALAIAERALVLAEEAGYGAGLAAAHLNVGWCENFLTRPGPAIASFQKALDGFQAAGDDLGAMKALNALGVAYHELGRYDRAMDYYTRSLEAAHRTKNRRRESVTLNNIGEICLELGEHKEALDYFLRAYETAPDDREEELVANVLLNIGTTFHRMENWPLAHEFTEKALVIALEGEDRLIEAQCLLALGRIAKSSERLETAEDYFLKALALNGELKNAKQGIEVLLELGSLQCRRGQPERGLERFAEALAGAEAIGAKALINVAYERLSEAHEALGDFRAALDYYRRFSRYEREVIGEDTSRKIKNITVQYEVEKSRQESEIYRLRNIELKQKTDELEEANRQIISISELGRRITSSLDLDTVVSTVYESLERHIDVTVFGIAVHDESENSIEWRCFMEKGQRLHRPLQRLDYERSYAAWAIKNRKTLFLRDAEAEWRRYLKGSRITHGIPAASLVFAPLTIAERVIGVLTVQSYEKNAYSEPDRILLEALCPYIAIAVENSLIHDHLEELNRAIIGEKTELEKAALKISHLANHDSLTGLPNRRLLFELLQKSFDFAARAKSLVGVFFIDLDDFKPINDQHGHFAGDRTLVAMAERLRGLLRASDTLARVGGDEFIAVLTNVADRKALELAAKKIIEECRRPLKLEGFECRLGLSMGVAVYPEDGTSIEELMNHADAAMYSVKREKKNGFAFYSAEGRS